MIIALLVSYLNLFSQVPEWAWAKSAGGASYDIGYAIATDAIGNIVVTGNFVSPTITFGKTTLTNSGENDIFVVKYDSSGNVLWAKSAGGVCTPDVCGDISTGISTDLNGNIVVTGYFNSPIIAFDSTKLTNSGSSSNIFVVKYNPNGNVIWAKSAGGTSWVLSWGISTDASGNIIITGNYYSPTLSFDSLTLSNIGENDIFVVKYDSNGNVLWAKSAGGTLGEEGYSVSTDANGNIVVTGSFSSPTLSFDSLTLSNIGENDIFVVKYDSNGNVLWAKSAGGTLGDEGYSVSTDANGNIIMTGFYNSPTILFGSTTLTNSGLRDFFVVKLSYVSTLGIVFNHIINTVKVYPNPSSTQVVIDNGNYSSMGSYTAKIVNALGQQVFQSVINQQQFVIDANTMGGAGVYTLYITDGNNKIVGVKKIVLQ